MTTQNCAECGTRAERGQPFCDACGTVLRWTEPARAGAGDTTAASDASGGARTVPQRIPDPSAAPTPAIPAAALPDEADTTIQMRAVAPADAMSDRARRLVVPVADPADDTAPPSVSPVLPGRPAATRPQVRSIDQESRVHGGPPCPWCDIPNAPDRRFCVRCAMPMAGDRQAAGGRPPWWRRMLDPRSREAPWAGERPRLGRNLEHLGRWLVAALVLTLLIVLAVHLPDGIGATRDHFAKRAQVEPDSFRASREFPDHPADLAFDKLNDTWWGPGISGSGEGEWIEVAFEQPTGLLDVIITPGVSTRAGQLRESALPYRVEARVTTEDGSTTTRQLTLDQGLGPQRRPFRAQGVTSVRFTLVSAYGAAGDKQVAIAEIEFFGRSSGGGIR